MSDQPAGESRDLAWPVYLAQSRDLGDQSLPHRIVLTGVEGRHAAAARRHRPGDMLVIADGAGAWVAGPVSAVRGKSEVEVEVALRGCEQPRTPRLTVALALLKSDRSDLAVDQLTEVGVDRIVGWSARHCVATWTPERAERGLARWRRTAAEAAKQSRRVRVPEIAGVVDTGELAMLAAASDAALVCHESADQTLLAGLDAAVAADASAQPSDILIVVGPEGGIADDELERLCQTGARPVSLGPTVLRAALAGAVAASIILAAAGRLSPGAAGEP